MKTLVLSADRIVIDDLDRLCLSLYAQPDIASRIVAGELDDIYRPFLFAIATMRLCANSQQKIDRRSLM